MLKKAGMKLRVGIIGLGVGEAHIQGYARHSSAEVVTLCDFDPKRLVDAKQKYPGLRFVENADDVLKAPDIDVVSIASYDNFHYRQIMMAIENGKHIFVEKPLCLHDFEARDIRKALRGNKLLKMSSNLILRKCPRFIEIKNRIIAGDMGELFHMDGSYDYGRRQKIIDGWRGKIDYYSGVCGGGVHLIDLFLWFSGQRVREVMAYGNRIVTRNSGFRNDDSVTAILQFESGMTGRVSVHLGSLMPHHHELNIYGEKATFMNNYEHPVYFNTQDPACKPEVMKQAYPGIHKGDLIFDFIESIVNNTQAEVGIEDIFSAMSVCFAVNKSLEKGKPVKVKYI
jgi:predicted dehydrogenase